MVLFFMVLSLVSSVENVISQLLVLTKLLSNLYAEINLCHITHTMKYFLVFCLVANVRLLQ